jgi:hypothetical protein
MFTNKPLLAPWNNLLANQPATAPITKETIISPVKTNF